LPGLFDPWIQDGKNLDPDPGSEMNIPDHFSDSLMRIGILNIFDTGSVKEKFESGINIPETQNWLIT
jgi:hypothetical protein